MMNGIKRIKFEDNSLRKNEISNMIDLRIIRRINIKSNRKNAPYQLVSINSGNNTLRAEKVFVGFF
jgi:outer membrane protease